MLAARFCTCDFWRHHRRLVPRDCTHLLLHLIVTIVHDAGRFGPNNFTLRRSRRGFMRLSSHRSLSGGRPESFWIDFGSIVDDSGSKLQLKRYQQASGRCKRLSAGGIFANVLTKAVVETILERCRNHFI